MKNLHVKNAAISALVIYVLGVSAFIASHFVSVMSDPEAQANLVLMIAIIPAAVFGAFLYYRRGHVTNGILLGAFLFLLTIVLDALITVPLFVIPAGGDHLTFFSDPGFWLIGLEYVLVVTAYWQVHKAIQAKRASSI